MICKCTECHHEWQQAEKAIRTCRWCGAPGKWLADDWMETMTDRDLDSIIVGVGNDNRPVQGEGLINLMTEAIWKAMPDYVMSSGQGAWARSQIGKAVKPFVEHSDKIMGEQHRQIRSLSDKAAELKKENLHLRRKVEDLETRSEER